MDVRAVLQAARAEAGFDQRRLALAAGTARTTVVAYETGAQSPTVRQLERLLAACGLRARVVLEPLTADVDEVLDEASRLWLRTQRAKGWDRHGFSLAPNWYETAEQARVSTRRPVHCLLGFVHVRLVTDLPAGLLPLLLDGRAVPVLPLHEVRRAHAPLAELLDRHEHRLAAERGSRTV